MSPSTRRTVLAGTATSVTGILAGCIGGPADEPTATTSIDADESAGTTSTETSVFKRLSTDEMPTDCPMPDYAALATTPVPYPTPAAPSDAGVAIDLATDIEAAYLDNWVVLNYDPLPTATTTPATPTVHQAQYPAVSASYHARTVRQRETGVVVHLQYERRIGGEMVGNTLSTTISRSRPSREPKPPGITTQDHIQLRRVYS